MTALQLRSDGKWIDKRTFVTCGKCTEFIAGNKFSEFQKHTENAHDSVAGPDDFAAMNRKFNALPPVIKQCIQKNVINDASDEHRIDSRERERERSGTPGFAKPA